MEFSIVCVPANPEALIIDEGGNLSDQSEESPQNSDEEEILNTNMSAKTRLLMKAGF